MIKNSRQRKLQRRKVAIEQVKARIKRAGKAANAAEQEKKGITKDTEKKRLEQAKYELNLLEKRT